MRSAGPELEASEGEDRAQALRDRSISARRKWCTAPDAQRAIRCCCAPEASVAVQHRLPLSGARAGDGVLNSSGIMHIVAPPPPLTTAKSPSSPPPSDDADVILGRGNGCPTGYAKLVRPKKCLTRFPGADNCSPLSLTSGKKMHTVTL